jgi:hypothetical protein
LLLEEFAREITASIHAWRVAGTLQEQRQTIAVARNCCVPFVSHPLPMITRRVHVRPVDTIFSTDTAPE